MSNLQNEMNALYESSKQRQAEVDAWIESKRIENAVFYLTPELQANIDEMLCKGLDYHPNPALTAGLGLYMFEDGVYVVMHEGINMNDANKIAKVY